MSDKEGPQFGVGDGSFQLAGGEAGVRRLVDDFYDLMSEREDAMTIRQMHPDDLAESRDKLSCFLCGWLGGPRRYHEIYGAMHIPTAHAHLKIGKAERDAWLTCMAEAVARQSYPSDFAAYLMRQFAIPAQRVYETSQMPDSGG